MSIQESELAEFGEFEGEYEGEFGEYEGEYKAKYEGEYEGEGEGEGEQFLGDILGSVLGSEYEGEYEGEFGEYEGEGEGEQFLGDILGSVLGGEYEGRARARPSSSSVTSSARFSAASSRPRFRKHRNPSSPPKLLEITSEQELEQFLGNIFKSVGGFINVTRRPGARRRAEERGEEGVAGRGRRARVDGGAGDRDHGRQQARVDGKRDVRGRTGGHAGRGGGVRGRAAGCEHGGLRRAPRRDGPAAARSQPADGGPRGGRGGGSPSCTRPIPGLDQVARTWYHRASPDGCWRARRRAPTANGGQARLPCRARQAGPRPMTGRPGYRAAPGRPAPPDDRQARLPRRARQAGPAR